MGEIFKLTDEHRLFHTTLEKRFDIAEEKEKAQKQVEKMSQPEKAKFGRMLGRILVEFLESKYINKPKLDEDDIRELDGVYNFYSEVMKLDDVEKLILKNGFLAEYAVPRAALEVGFEVRHSTEEEDLQNKVDFWIDDLPRNDQRLLAFQVKCLSGIKEVKSFILNNDKEYKSLMQYSIENHDAISKIDNFDINIGIMLDFVKEKSNVVPILIIVPSPETVYAVFNSRHALPDEKFINMIDDEINEKLDVYEEVAA